MPNIHTRGAQISACGNFRYRLWRIWGEAPRVLFVMLNPSTADADNDDATVRWLMGWAERNGFGGIEVCNLYAYRTKSPKELKRAGYPAGEGNLRLLLSTAKLVDNSGGKVVCAWGAHAEAHWAHSVRLCLEDAAIVPYALKINAGGSPAHPLYLPGGVEATQWCTWL